jgi:O-acetyl-ADP-ribose deacetylase
MKQFGRIFLLKDDITKLKVDAIVNAANSRLAGGGGVDGAIHKTAGPELRVACRKLGGCPTGSAKITSGYLLPSKFIIHTVGPVWKGGNSNENVLLANCYKSCFDIALKDDISSIAFPNISTGIYGFPKKDAALIAIEEVKLFVNNYNNPEKIYFVCFDEDNYNLYNKILSIDY